MWFRGVSRCAWAVTCLVVACSGKDHPAFIAPTYVPSGHAGVVGSSGSDAADVGGADAGGADSGGSASQGGSSKAGVSGSEGGDANVVPPTPTGGGSSATFIGPFDPNQAYMIATLRKVPVEGIAAVTALGSIAVTVPVGAPAIRNGALVYGMPQEPVYQFVRDVVGAINPKGNDPILDTPPCLGTEDGVQRTGPRRFLIGPTGRFIYECVYGDGYYENGKIVYTGVPVPIALGSGDLMLVLGATPGVIDLKDGIYKASTVLHEPYPSVFRANNGGFDMLIERDLHHIDGQGTDTTLGTYPDLPAKFSETSIAIMPDRSLFQLERASTGDGFAVYQHPLGASRHVVSTQPPSSVLGIGRLITGP